MTRFDPNVFSVAGIVGVAPSTVGAWCVSTMRPTPERAAKLRAIRSELGRSKRAAPHPPACGGGVSPEQGQLPGCAVAFDWETSRCLAQSACPARGLEAFAARTVRGGSEGHKSHGGERGNFPTKSK